mgnify:CR=1 FL=1
MPIKWPLVGRRRSDGELQDVAVTPDGAIYIAQDVPPLAYLVNSWAMWSVGEAVLVASVTALPTTTAQISLYNNEEEGGKSYILQRVYAIVGAVPAGLSQFGIAHCIHRIKPATRPTLDIPYTSFTNMKARSGAYQGRAIFDLALTVADDLWKPLGYSILNAVSAVGWQADVWVDGLVIIPPGGLYSAVAVSNSTSVTTRMGFTWAEVQLPLVQA